VRATFGHGEVVWVDRESVSGSCGGGQVLEQAAGNFGHRSALFADQVAVGGRALTQAAPLRPLPDGIVDLGHFRVLRRRSDSRVSPGGLGFRHPQVLQSTTTTILLDHGDRLHVLPQAYRIELEL
jgi:hypothetical protein